MEDAEKRRGRRPMNDDEKRAYLSVMVPPELRRWVKENVGKGKLYRSAGHLVETAIEALRSSNKE